MMSRNLKPWRESASIILLAKDPYLTNKQPNGFNYKLLTIKRSSNSSFMPGTNVFPGGVLDKADTVHDWFELYERLGINKNAFDIFNNVKYKAPIFKNEGTESIPKYLSLRIAAVRETFEECGILICKNKNSKTNTLTSRWASHINDMEILEWQKKVHKDASQLLKLCQKFEIYPDIWALHEWSNWVTPADMNKRFETIFFLAALANIPSASADTLEVQQLQWDTPNDYLLKVEKDEILLPPPQFYELSRLINFPAIEEISKFAQTRSVYGCQRFLPYRLSTDDYQVTLLPGDDMYPGDEKAEYPCEEIFEDIPQTKKMHRILYTAGFKSKITLSNYTPKYKHVLPLTIMNKNSKL